MYNNPQEFIRAAIDQGLVRFIDLTIRVGSIDIKTPNAISIVNYDGWMDFLKNVVKNSIDASEVAYANIFLEQAKKLKDQLEIQNQVSTEIQLKEDSITDKDINVLHKNLENCQTIDDVLDLMNNKNIFPEKISWQRPIKVNNKYRYYAHNSEWYIEQQIKKGIYYSIFNPDAREIARYDTLKVAKLNMLNIIKCFS